MPYTTDELMDKIRKLQEKEKQQQEEYCDCHERCPRCGKKLKPNSNWGRHLFNGEHGRKYYNDK